jgi:phosphatidylglycerophosphatase A
MHKLIATGLGIGYIRKGAGTVASIVCCGVWYTLSTSTLIPQGDLGIVLLFVTAMITAVGIWSSTVVEEQWGKDSNRVVIDEIAGMCLSLLFVPVSVKNVLIGLFLFRLLDISKPFGIRKLEKLSGGWGVMLDDLLAGFYANMLLQIAIRVGLF